MRNILFILLFFVSFLALAQQDSIVHLKEVVLTDVSLQQFSSTVSKVEINDSVIKTNSGSLTQLLNNNTGIYFKENGKGMVSSVSFRGTTAQQTAVIWNGINVNSQLNGQTDFNTINPTDFNKITVRSGGGSVSYGSGAIGGSVHLNNDISFVDKTNNSLQIQYGSFETTLVNYKLKKSTNKHIVNFNVTRNQSVNNYEYVGYEKKNENGNYDNISFNSVFGYKFNRSNSLKLYSYYYNGERFFSGTINSPSKSKYLDLNTRNLLEWENTSFKNLVSKFKVAYLNEVYKYFENKDSELFSTGKANTLLIRSNLLYNLNSRMKMSSIIQHNYVEGSGTNIELKQQQISSFSILFTHELFSKLNYEVSLRKELTEVYKSPLLYTFSFKYSPFSFYALRAVVSKNFRIPTYNDLYWQGSGSLSLKPEQSQQFEFSNDFKLKKLEVTITGFYNKMTDMLRWVPNSSGQWQPMNTDQVNITGLESSLKLKGKIKNMSYNIVGNYSFTKSEDNKNGKQLIYVPFHKFSSSLGLRYKAISFVYQYNFNDLVYTSSDNKNKLPKYGLSNLYVNYSFQFLSKTTLGFQLLNVENKPYQNVLSRPMPGRNYMFNLNLIF